VPGDPGASPDPETTLEPVFETADAAILPLATMALDQQGIEYSVQGGGSLDALRLPPPGLDVGRSDARHELVVRKEDAARAREILADLDTLANPSGSSGLVRPPPFIGESGESDRPVPIRAARPAPVVVDVETGATIGSITAQQAQFLIDALEESSPDEPRYYIDAATIEMLETSGGDTEVIALLRQALGGREGMEIRF
jgi:processive 1,2-diacylglycerol beta-glucosyltransferase